MAESQQLFECVSLHNTKNASLTDLANSQRILADIQASQALADIAARASDALNAGGGL